MIDVRWFEQIRDMAGADLGGQDPSRLCDRLGVIEEVWPYLITLAGGFAEWPQTRAALSQAAKSHTRPSMMRPPASAGTPPRAGGGAIGALRQSLNSLLVANDVNWKPDWEERGPATADVERLLKAARLESSTTQDNPQLFIASE